jgi:hypothetical protein
MASMGVYNAFGSATVHQRLASVCHRVPRKLIASESCNRRAERAFPSARIGKRLPPPAFAEPPPR